MSKERLSVDIGDFKDRVENCRKDPSWHELSFSGKLRSLILERLEQIDPIQPPSKDSLDILRQFFDDVVDGKYYADQELATLANDLDVSVDHLIAHQDCFKKKRGKVGK